MTRKNVAGNGPQIAAPSPSAAAQLRHDLRTPVNLIIGYCEMLLEDAAAPEHAVRRGPLEEALAAVREGLAAIDAALPTSRAAIEPRDLAALGDSLAAARGRILRAMDALVAGPGEGDFEADVRRIRGAVERLRVAADPGEQQAAPRASMAGIALPADRKGTARARILIVDDVEDNRAVLERRLGRQGYDTACAENGRRALELVAEQRYDLVLLDLMMPEMDGYAVLERLKSAPETRDIPVIVISALDDLPSVVRCIERGAEDYLSKPFDPVLLRARIGASVEKKRLRDAEVEYLREVERVIAAATAVEAGRYESGSLAAVAARADAVGRLARVFDAMASSVKTREERLRSVVAALRREIGVARRSVPALATETRLSTLAPGQRFADRYEILEALGSGGMGMVYRARDRELGEEVAIKTLRPEFMAGDEQVLERFKTETRLARRISHRNVVRTHDLGEWDGQYFLTMEYVEGMTVRTLIDARGTLAVSSTLAIGSQLADALEVAHEGGVIHRDIKPQNLLLDDQGVLKVMDFGVARLAERSSPLTQAGIVVGTPAYMAPEQLFAEHIDARSDLYSVGVVLYECLTGRLPFEAKSVISLVAKILSEEPSPPAALNAEVPAALSALVMRLLAREPAGRPQRAAELRELLAQMA